MATVQATLCDTIAARAAEMQADLARHVAIPTGHNHAPGLDEYRGIILERLETLDGATTLIPGDPEPPWLRGGDAGPIPPTAVCRRPVDGRPRIMLAGHLDTVFHPDEPFREMVVSADGRTATGPGVVDMKGGVLAAVVALEALAEAGTPVSWTVLLNADEERGSYHSDRALIDTARAHDVGLALEPALPDGSLAVERKGSGQFLVETRGRSAHAGREFDKGVSAVYRLARALVAIERMSDPASGVTVNIGPIEGGQASNIVPDRARAWGNVRYPDADHADRIGRMLDDLATPDGAMPAVRVHRAFNRPAKPLTPAVRALAERARSVAESLGQQLPFASTGGVCDGNIMQAAGLPTIDTVGVRGGGLHTHDEWIELASLVGRAQLLACLLAEITTGSADG